MIVREYYQNINIHRPRNYFEHWYSDLWRRRINAKTAPPGLVEYLMTEELAKISATFKGKDYDYKFVVTFNNDADYTAFVLRWS
jgi:hypothetical protein